MINIQSWVCVISKFYKLLVLEDSVLYLFFTGLFGLPVHAETESEFRSLT